MGVVKAVCTSNIKGIQKTEQDAIELKSDWGIEGDAHGGPWHRQVSLLSSEQVEAFKARGADVGHGSFGENIVVEGFDLKSLPIGTRFACGDVVLELTQIGKQCHAQRDHKSLGFLRTREFGTFRQKFRRTQKLRERHETRRHLEGSRSGHPRRAKTPEPRPNRPGQLMRRQPPPHFQPGERPNSHTRLDLLASLQPYALLFPLRYDFSRGTKAGRVL